MSKTIVFKSEFEAKLKKLKIKTKFIKNWKANKWENNDDPIYSRNIANNTTSWNIFIVWAFNWKLTPEGHCYWEHISNL
jgi:hypothetical protein